MLHNEISPPTTVVENKSSAVAEASSTVFLNSPNLRWLVIGASVGIALVVLAVVIACWYSVKKKRQLLKEKTDEKLNSVVMERGAEGRCSTSTETSMDSIELPKDRGHKNLRPSLSFDVNAPFLFRKHSVQPCVTLPRWNSLSTPRSSIGTVQPELSNSDSEDSSATPNNNGRLWFSILYNEETSNLQVTLVRAKYLPARGLTKGVRDPFVKIFLMPDEENYKQSKVRKRTLSPKFNEVFNFEVRKEELSKRFLRFSVYDLDKRRIRHCLGHVVVCLCEADLVTNCVLSKVLEKIPQRQSNGELQISLACNPFNNRLKVTINNGRNINIQGYQESLVYIKTDLFHGQKLVKSKRTASRSVVGTSKSELIFHEGMSFGVPAKFYDSCYIAITAVLTGGNLAKDQFLGRVTLGPYLFSRGENLLHWQEMVSNPRTIVTRWHKLECEL